MIWSLGWGCRNVDLSHLRVLLLLSVFQTLYEKTPVNRVCSGTWELNGPSIKFHEAKTSRSKSVYSINQWAAHWQVSKLQRVSAITTPLLSIVPSRLLPTAVLHLQDGSCMLSASAGLQPEDHSRQTCVLFFFCLDCAGEVSRGGLSWSKNLKWFLI